MIWSMRMRHDAAASGSLDDFFRLVEGYAPLSGLVFTPRR